ncbi:Pentatricopeptide repeat-containing protein, mitochondrial [Quillaja saponaria]|uniref:Pentatricopeptide repeat-containing protein, mitochondrial n=1 Tax=Quillaja saponaria TaxID=32244 RepID=A0AAD7LJP3_QUISA|nr:Pentatricopeptide repeat-containing protein, mitochondrial [Quillaja saponaria]
MVQSVQHECSKLEFHHVATFASLIIGFCRKMVLPKEGILNFILMLSALNYPKLDSLQIQLFICDSNMAGFRNMNNLEAAVDCQKKMIKEGTACDLLTYSLQSLFGGLRKEGTPSRSTCCGCGYKEHKVYFWMQTLVDILDVKTLEVCSLRALVLVSYVFLKS